MAREREQRRKGPANDRRRVQKKKVSILTQDKIDWVDYKDVNLLRRFMSERAKIRARRVTGNNAQQQREIAKAIRIAREMALLPYSVRQVTQRSRSGRRDRDRLDPTAPMPTPDAPPPIAGEGEGDVELPEGVTLDAGIEAEYADLAAGDVAVERPVDAPGDAVDDATEASEA
jgi:small subunit ribosomal protein S18